MSKARLLGVCLILILLAATGMVGCGQEKSRPPGKAARPEDLARAVVDGLRRGDIDAVVAYAFQDCDVESVLAELRRSRDPAEMDRLEKQVRGLGAEARGALWQGFDKLRRQAEADGVHWPETKLVRADYIAGQEKGFLGADVYVTIACRDREYGIKLDDCLKAARGWVMADEPVWNARGGVTQGVRGPNPITSTRPAP